MKHFWETQLKIQLVGRTCHFDAAPVSNSALGFLSVSGDDDSFLKYTSIHLLGFVLKVVPRPPVLGPKGRSAHSAHGFGGEAAAAADTDQRGITLERLELFRFPIDTASIQLAREPSGCENG